MSDLIKQLRRSPKPIDECLMLCSQAADLIEQLQQRIAELEQALVDDATAKIMLEKLAFENGQLDMRMSGNIFHIFCEAFVKTFKETGAENYLTTEFHSSELGAFTVTMQRSQGMTVYEKLRKVQQERDELSATVEKFIELRDHLPNVRQWVIEFEKLVHKTPQQNLNAVKLGVLDGLIKYGCELRHQRWVTNPINGVERPTLEEAMKQEFVISRSDIERYANTKYPSGKDGE